MHRRKGKTRRRSIRRGNGRRRYTRNRRNRMIRHRGGATVPQQVQMLKQLFQQSDFRFTPQLQGLSTVLLTWSMVLNPIIVGLEQKNDYINAVFLLHTDCFLDCNAIFDRLAGPALSQSGMQEVFQVFGKRQLLVMIMILPTFCGMASAKMQLPEGVVKEAASLLRRMVREICELNGYDKYNQYRGIRIEELGPGQAGGAVGISSFLLSMMVFLLLLCVAQVDASLFQQLEVATSMGLVPSALDVTSSLTNIKLLSDMVAKKSDPGYNVVASAMEYFPDFNELAKYNIKTQNAMEYWQEYKGKQGLPVSVVDVKPMYRSKLQNFLDTFFRDGAGATYLQVAKSFLQVVQNLHEVRIESDDAQTLVASSLKFLEEVGKDLAKDVVKEAWLVAAPPVVKHKLNVMSIEDGRVRFKLLPGIAAKKIEFSVDLEYALSLVQMSKDDIGKDLVNLGNQQFLKEVSNNAVAILSNQLSGANLIQYSDAVIALLTKFGTEYITNLGEVALVTTTVIELLTVDQIKRSQAQFSIAKKTAEYGWNMKETMFGNYDMMSVMGGYYTRAKAGVLAAQNWMNAQVMSTVEVINNNPVTSVFLGVVLQARPVGISQEDIDAMNRAQVKQTEETAANLVITLSAEQLRAMVGAMRNKVPEKRAIDAMDLVPAYKKALYVARTYLDQHNYDSPDEIIPEEDFKAIAEEIMQIKVNLDVLIDYLSYFKSTDIQSRVDDEVY